MKGGDQVNNIKKLREEGGYSQQSLADKVGVHKNTVINWETGETDMKSADLVKLSNVLDCSIEDILLPTLEECEAI